MDTTKLAAAQARAAAMGGPGLGDRFGSAEIPRELGAARACPFPASLRAKLEDRDGQALYHLSGIASVTDKPYEMYDAFGPYEEIVAREAFTDTLASAPDVAFLVNHKGVTMARTTNGSLELAMVDEGLGVDAWVNPKRTDVKDLVTAVTDRHIDQMSFAFMLEQGWWSDDFSTFKITKLSIDRGDVSAVNYGANPYTSIAARAATLLADLDRMPVGMARAALTRLAGRADLTPQTTTGEEPAPQSDGAPLRPGGMRMTSISAWLAAVDLDRA